MQGTKRIPREQCPTQTQFNSILLLIMHGGSKVIFKGILLKLMECCMLVEHKVALKTVLVTH